MTKFDGSQIELFVFTFKEGLLSKVAHDLKIKAKSLDVSVDGDHVHASIDPQGLEIVCARKDGRDAHGTLSGGDKRKIIKSMHEDVLHSKRHPAVTFHGTIESREKDGFEITALSVQGELSLHGATKPLTLSFAREGSRMVAKATLHQPDFGIKPFEAMFGTLKVKAGIEVQISAPAG